MAIFYYSVDTETTGLSSSVNEINQISIIRVADGFQRSWNIAVANPQNASKEALAVQGITRADLKKGEPLAKVVQEVNDFIAEDGMDAASRCFIGHNVAFDRRFCHAEWARMKQKFPGDLWLCTKKFYGSYVKRVGDQAVIQKQGLGEKKVKYGQDLCLVGAGIKPKIGAHSATIDVQNNLTLYQFLMDQKLDYVRSIEKHVHVLPGTAAQEMHYDFE